MANAGLDTVIGATRNDPAAAAPFIKKAQQAESDGHWVQALEAWKEAAAKDRTAKNLFACARLQDRLGFDDDALRTYEECTRLPSPPVNAYLNMAVLLEDAGQFTRAEKLLKKVLEANPNHDRAHLFMKDVRASKDMLYDEEFAREGARRDALMDTPVPDFELSVRARNCLKKMQIRTLGDLLKITESELLAYKNFGETSLIEIKQMLAAKGLRLGQQLDRGHYDKIRSEMLEKLKGTVSEEVLNRPLSQLE
ncbi:MAG: DNA-directed RNA polymerase subunit alpha C-terminal domain-containing protein, partial [Planctomycetota bacterium]